MKAYLAVVICFALLEQGPDLVTKLVKMWNHQVVSQELGQDDNVFLH